MKRIGAIIDKFEQIVIATLLAVMTLLTAGQALAREVFGVSNTWALEVMTVLLAWLILFGMSYGIKTRSHLGVDAFVKLFPERIYRGFAVFAALACILYAVILIEAGWLKFLLGDAVNARGGAWTYVQKMKTIGIELENVSVPRWIAYSILPVGLALFAFRATQAAWQIIRGERSSLIAAHEAEDMTVELKSSSAAQNSQTTR